MNPGPPPPAPAAGPGRLQGPGDLEPIPGQLALPGMPSAAEANLRPAGNRDGKRALSERGRAAVCWLHARAPLQENVLIRLPGRDVAAIFAAGSGQQRVNELSRRCRGAQGPGLCPVHPAGGRRLAARLRR